MKRSFPAEPTATELASLRNHLERSQRPGLFIDRYCFCTFDDLPNELCGAAPDAAASEGSETSPSIDGHNASLHSRIKNSDRKPDQEDEGAHLWSDEDEGQAEEAAQEGSESADINRALLVAPMGIPLYDAAQLLTLREKLGELTGGTRGADEKLMKRIDSIIGRGNQRRLVTLSPQWFSQLDGLAARFLNFRAVIDYVRLECQVASMSQAKAVKLAPILLGGEPGIGKTAFAMELAAILSGHFYMVHMENAQSGAALAGSAQFWTNTRTGKVFDALVDNEVINPVFLVDELDKVSVDGEYDPIAPLYQFLEGKTATAFRDESIPDLAIDASHINWLFTANDVDRVPAPIKSRLQIFVVPSPTPKQTRQIIEQIYTETVCALKQTVVDTDYSCLLNNMKITSAVLDVISANSIRVVKRLVRKAIVSALARGSSVIDFQDVYDLGAFEIDPIHVSAH